jgi:hypothetical protein
MRFIPIPQGELHRLLINHRFALVSANDIDRMPGGCTLHSTAAGALQASDELLPRLVDLTELQPGQRDEFLDACVTAADGEPPAVVLLKSDAEPGLLAAHLGRMQTAKSASGEKAWLRVHDPRVWFQLNRVVSVERMNTLMGPIGLWTFFLAGQWVSQENTGPRMAVSRFDDSTWSALERIGVVNRVISRIDPVPKVLDDMLLISQKADQLAERAGRRYQLNRLDDQVEFCLLGLRVHAQFDEHPRVRDVFARVSQDPSAFDELLAHDETFWRSVRQTLNTTGEGKP